MPDPRPHILVPLLRAQAAPALLAVAEAMRQREGGAGHLLGFVQVHGDGDFSRSVTVARRYRALLRRLGQHGRSQAFGVQVRVGVNLTEAVRQAARENGSTLLVLEWMGPGARRPLEAAVEDLIADPPCDLLLVRPGEAPPGSDDAVLVPVRGGHSAELALRVASAISKQRHGGLIAMHVYDPSIAGSARVDEQRQFRDALHVLGRSRRQLVEVESATPEASIRAEASHHQVVVLGAHVESRRSSVVVGLRLAEVVRRMPGTVVVAKSSRQLVSRWDLESSPHSLFGPRDDIQRVVDRWFAENTFHAREFRDIARLARLKREQGVTISLGLPTLNESATIGRIIDVMQAALVERHQLLDEIVVIDSGSTDATVEIARSRGVAVYQHSEVLPEYGSERGKGEALWKSLHVLRGDIVAWCDTDISNIHPQFVYGVVGPLLTDPRIGYVKGFYRRPLKFAGHTQAAGGGRVTELTARPVINLFYPELSGLLQPLSGEYAGRRELLERLPFFTGYGVEIGHLIDVLESFGLNRIAQTDLGVRIHRNQDLFALSRMAFAILQVAMKRLGDRHRMHVVEEMNRTMKLINYQGDRFFLELRDIGDVERPAMVGLPEYLVRRVELAGGPPSASSAS